MIFLLNWQKLDNDKEAVIVLSVRTAPEKMLHFFWYLMTSLVEITVITS